MFIYVQLDFVYFFSVENGYKAHIKPRVLCFVMGFNELISSFEVWLYNYYLACSLINIHQISTRAKRFLTFLLCVLPPSMSFGRGRGEASYLEEDELMDIIVDRFGTMTKHLHIIN